MPVQVHSQVTAANAMVNPLAKTDHRPWPVPDKPWIMVQVWRDLLFAHWDVPAEMLRPLVPKQLELDTYAGRAWLSITPFHMSLRLRGLPIMPGMRRLPEINLRTYVVVDDKPGIFFFSLDIASYAAVLGARAFYHLPYFRALMRFRKRGDRIFYSSRRGRAVFRAEYAPKSAIRRAAPGSLDHWLAERYCLYSVYKDRVYRGQIHHVPWPLQTATVRIAENTIANSIAQGIGRDPTLVAFSRELKVLIWPPERLGD